MVENAHWYTGAEGTIDCEDKLQFNMQYVYREDENPWLQSVGATRVETRGGFAELIYAPQGVVGRHWEVFRFTSGFVSAF